ncbi:MAG TPA: hypothetical protein VKB76_06215, partial [Ktedonobacterales bacterium]|nr:hypothetical protein [Ktedonobacterales bacterium]
IDALPEAERVNWDAFRRKHVLMGGQIVARPIRQRMRRSVRLDPDSLTGESVLYISSDTGQLMARTTRFTLWLERYLELHPDLYAALELAEEHRDKPLLEFLPPMSVQFEFDPQAGIIVTLWKHQPLVRYVIGDLLWTRSASDLIAKLTRVAPTWRRDFLAAGGHPLDIPKVATFGVVLGRADEICIVNAANVSPAMVQQALENAGIAAEIHYFKHYADPAYPNAYYLAVELEGVQDEQARKILAEQWRGKILEALLAVPSATDLVAAHRTNPIDFSLTVHSRGEDEFHGGQHKQTHAMRRPTDG